MKGSILSFLKESDCTENPGGHDLRSTIVPADVPRYLADGWEIRVEQGIGERIGWHDREYELAGALVVDHALSLSAPGLKVKLKGPDKEDISLMGMRSTLFSMGHLYAFPERAQALRGQQITQVGMETIPWPRCLNEEILSGMRSACAAHRSGAMNPVITSRVSPDWAKGFVRGSMWLGAHSVLILPPDQKNEECEWSYHPEKDGEAFHDLLLRLIDRPGRAIGQPNEVGRGALKYVDQRRAQQNIGKDSILLIGYGDVALGALHEAMIRQIPVTVVGRKVSGDRDSLATYVSQHSVLVNGAEGEAGETLIRHSELVNCANPPRAVADLIGGSPSLPSPVDAFEWTTFMPDLSFTKDGIEYAGLWSWDMWFDMVGTTEMYSAKIAAILNGHGYASDLDKFHIDYRTHIQSDRR